DDEAFKKAFTDATLNGFKALGVAADIHMGLFDDDKYVSAMEREFSAQPTITDEQQNYLIDLCNQTGVNLGDFLKVGGCRDVRDVPADKFENAKAWIMDRAKEKEPA